MFDLMSADCVTFTERSIALGCATDWSSYHTIAIRLRHAGDSQNFLDCNFFPLTEWVPNNQWLLDDLTEQLGVSPAPFEYVARPQQFYSRLEFGEDDTPLGRQKSAAKAAKIASLPEIIVHRDHYISVQQFEELLPTLATGDVWLSIRTREAPGLQPWYDCDHMGILINNGAEFSLVHAVPPAVQRQSLAEYVAERPWTKGFKILRTVPKARASAKREVARLRALPGGYNSDITPARADQVVAAKKAYAEARSNDCILSGGPSGPGPGCCDVNPPVCSHILYTYNTDCVGSGDCVDDCRPIAFDYVRVYYYYDCYGNCSNPIETCIHDFSTLIDNYGWEPSVCKWVKSANNP